MSVLSLFEFTGNTTYMNLNKFTVSCQCLSRRKYHNLSSDTSKSNNPLVDNFPVHFEHL